MVRTEDIQLWKEYQKDWPRFAREILGVTMDEEQEKILRAIQENKKVHVRSGHARGKDFIAAVAALCFFYLFYPSKVICTAPTARQAIKVNMAEISKLHRNARIPLPGRVLDAGIKTEDTDWFLMAFKAGDKDHEAWTGFHSSNIMVIATEASGLEDNVFNAVEGILTGGNSKLVLLSNPNRASGFAYQATKDKYFVNFKLSCLTSPNVVQKKQVYPGQVDYDWVQERIERWCIKIDKEEFNEEFFDFEWEGEYYRPNDLFKVKVLGEYPAEDESQLIPLRWVEMAVERWKEMQKPDTPAKHGIDIAGMGRDKTVCTSRYVNYVTLKEWNLIKDAHVHMAAVAKIKETLKEMMRVLLIQLEKVLGFTAVLRSWGLMWCLQNSARAQAAFQI